MANYSVAVRHLHRLEVAISAIALFSRTMAAATKVFETYELLENIQASIDTPRSIFVIQRICKSWRAIVEGSATIQQLVLGASATQAVGPS